MRTANISRAQVLTMDEARAGHDLGVAQVLWNAMTK